MGRDVWKDLAETCWAAEQAAARLRLLGSALREAQLPTLAGMTDDWASELTRVVNRLQGQKVPA